MLILTRRVGEVIRIGDQIKIVVLGVAGGKARIGVDAPIDVSVHREEIFYKLKNENRLSQADPNDDDSDSELDDTGSKKTTIRYKRRKRHDTKD